MHVLIVDQCCKQKAYPEDSETLTVDDIDTTEREVLLNRDDIRSIPAADLYVGRQQEAIDRAVTTLRAAGHTVTRVFISAGFGVIGESESLAPYNVTFSGMSTGDIRERADQLSITPDLLEVIRNSPNPDIAFFALGADYFTALDTDAVLSALPDETITVLYNSEERASALSNTISLPARNTDASQYGVNAIELKGHYIERFASRLEVDDKNQPLTPECIRSICTENESSQSDLDSF
ncbi:hypothetical protein [Halorubrum sp. Eb13]|uniref:hypothetical protein n=1 Tax=Halorubrum sp. Eb13 TaxID=1383843 RepID=UPI00113FE644|nr:hypothetical protein [Halorubrum sp. Eb13]